MLKAVVGVVAGYFVMFLFLFLALTGAYLAMGADGAFQPGSYEPSTVWLVVMFLVGLVAAMVGGLVCAAIAPASRAPVALAVVVLVIGLLSAALPVFLPAEAAKPTVRTGDVGNLEAMMSARTPTWVNVANPILGVIGVMLGARWKERGARA